MVTVLCGEKKKFISQQFWQTRNKRICSLPEAAVSSYFSLNDIVFIEPYSVDVPDSSVQRPEVPSSVEIQGKTGVSSKRHSEHYEYC